MHRSSRRGSALIWVVVTLPVLIGLCSLAVDWGRVQLVRTELRQAADAAARHAAGAVGQGLATVRARAKDAADDNKADGTAVVLSDAEVVQGHWSASTKSFTPDGTPLNAVRVTARRSGANAVPLMFARVLGKASFNVEASATAQYRADPATMGFVGLNGITFFNNTFVGSYNSNVIKTPLEGYSTGRANLATNGVIQSHNNTVLKGNVTLGPAGSTIATAPSGTTTKLSSPIQAPADPPWNPGTNPGNLSRNLTTSGPLTLPGGTYWFTSVTLGDTLSFLGPATVYVNGNISVERYSITAYQAVPSNLKIYQLGNNRTFTCNNNFTLVGQISAPGADLVANNRFELYGTALFRSITLKNSAMIFQDEQAMSGIAGGGAGGIVSIVK